MNIPAPTQGGSIPQIEDGLYKVRFNDITYRVVEQFITDKDKFGKKDDGGRFDFEATVLNEKGEPVLLMDVKDGVDDPTLEFDLRQGKSIKVISNDERSNSYAVLKGILTPAEFAAWLASTDANPVDLSHVAGRIVNAQIGHNEKGYPQIDAFLGPVKGAK